MRREGRFHLARRVCHCDCGVAHRLPSNDLQKVPLEDSGSSKDWRSDCKISGCCGCSPNGAKRCFGHNYHHIARCGMCKPGRYHRAGGAKALKKVSGRNGTRSEWMVVLNDARTAGLTCTVDDYKSPLPSLPSPYVPNHDVVRHSTRNPMTLGSWFPDDFEWCELECSECLDE
eukprot:gnl/MRDRNA2_/MRDRNA2_87425_c0_seq1.p1 gnl/MRDRNA2_/MRDRNA2_87425_c0~~gnl/MRDRNA2_/MRDRNA2_87425_c0_seq1.p1  ORF type:complete len:173 (-),score=21.64 gnl/MRDRNA2_/MRDRNA2_87425_c0_seq1:175-693(-)